MNPILPIEQLMLLFLVLLAVSAWAAWKSSARCAGVSRYGVPMLRLLALVGLAAIAFNPGRWETQRTEQVAEWAVLADSSGSMAVRDVEGESRWSKAVKLAQQIQALPGREREVKFFHFDRELHSVASGSALPRNQTDGGRTDWIAAGNQALERYHATGKHLQGIVLLSDGRQVPPGSSEDFTIRARALGTRVYPLVLGSAVKTPDLAVATRRRQYLTFAGQPLTLNVHLTSRNLTNIRPAIELFDQTGTKIAEQPVALGTESEAAVRFQITNAPPGYSTYRLAAKPWPGETTTRNNEATFGVVALTEKVRVLYAEGTPYWDSKFVAQLLQKQSNLELSLIYRLTQDKYFSLGGGWLTNAALTSFPDEAAALARYDVMIAGKGFEYFMNRARIDRLKEFVRERGGGLIFARGKSYSGELPDLEPLEPLAWEREWTGEFHWEPTLAGEECGLFGEHLPGRKEAVWAQLPPLSRAVSGARRRPFVQVLAEGVTRYGERERTLPVVVSQRFGKGLVVLVNSDDLWQWDFFPKFEGATALYHDFWRQLLHWAVTYADFLPGHEWSMRLSETLVETGQPVRAQVQRRDSSTAEAVQPRVCIYAGSDLVNELPLANRPEAREQWEAVLTLNRPGTFRVEMRQSATNSPILFETLAVTAPADEQDDLSPDRDAMTQLARSTDGKLISEADLTSLFQAPPPETLPPSPENAEWVAAWDRGLWLTLVLGAFAGEWFLRRRNGLT